MKKIIIPILLLVTSALFSVNNRESGNIFYENSYSGYGVDQVESDLSVEDLYINFHNDDSILIYITGHAPGDDIEDYLDFGVDGSTLFIESIPTNFFGFTHYSIKVEITLPSNYVNYYDIRSSTGEVYIDTPITPREFKAQSSTGDMFFESIKAERIAIETSTGEKEIGEIEASDLFLKSSTGDNRLGRILAEKGEVRTSTGQNFITDYKGDLKISSSTGDTEIEGFSSGELYINTSTGEVIVKLSQDNGWDLDINTSTGDIDSSLPIMIVGDIDEDHLRGSVNNGGYRVSIKTSTGDVTLR